MKHELPIDWPPLRAGARLSRRVILRDILLTVGAWLLLVLADATRANADRR